MMTTLLYHRIGTKGVLSCEEFEKTLLYLNKHYSFAFPEEFSCKNTSVCLTFDDATFDFYHYVFPLLKKHKIKAILAVCPSFVLDKTDIPIDKRLSFSEEGLFTPLSRENGHFCTYEELQEMVESKWIKIANHSFSHKNLLEEGLDLEKEVVDSKRILESMLLQKIDIFVFPYGKFDSFCKKFVKKHYPYQMRIGSAINLFHKNLIYRIPCDKITDVSRVFSFSFRISCFFKTLVNLLKNR